MTDSPRRRGRPKGTGIDDRVLLGRIAEIMTREQGTKPTTAIRAAGIDDPSAVRRLREKLKQHAAAPHPAIGRPPLPDDIVPQTPTIAAPPPIATPIVAEPPQSLPPPAQIDSSNHLAARAADTPGTTPTPPPAAPPPIDPLTRLMHMSVAAAANGLQLQARILEQMIEWPAAHIAVRQQAKLAETMIEAVAEQQRRLAGKK